MSTRTESNRHYGQVAVVLAPEDFATVQGMAEALEKSRAQVIRELVSQGIVALRAAAAAQDAGLDVDAAVFEAITEANQARDNTVLFLLDTLNDYLEHMEHRRPRDAYLLAGGAATALRSWADQCAVRHPLAEAN